VVSKKREVGKVAKTRDLTPVEAIGNAMFGVLKPYYKEGRRRIKGAKSRAREAQRQANAYDKGMPLNAACFEVMTPAVAHVSGAHTLPYGARRLYYRVRELIKQYTDAALTYKYFRDTILRDYQRERGKLRGLYYDPRGRLHEPHGGRTVDMGTLAVEAYQFPAHAFNKLLYVEKKGQFPLLQNARLMERYDLAIMTGEGFATEAARTLLANADQDERIQIFVLHDADPSGYDIARTVREETERMPGYSVDVIDLGLTVDKALKLGVEPEEFVRTQALGEKLLGELWGDALSLFTGEERTVRDGGKTKTVWDCKRIELDALTAPQAVTLVEEGLRAEGVFGKVIPPDEELQDLTEAIYREEAEKWAEEALEELTLWNAIKEALADKFMEQFKLENSDRYIRARFKKNDALSWKNALRDVLTDIHQAKHTDSLKEALREKVIEALEKPENGGAL